MALHGTHSCIHEEEPVVDFVGFTRSLGETDLVLRVVAFNQILHNTSRFEEVDGLAIGEGISQGRNATIGIDGAEPWLFLGVFADVDFVDFVRETGLKH